MQCARQNPYEFFLHEYVNFVHGTEKPYRSLSIKIYIFMQCAPKSFSRISRLDSMAKCVKFSHIWPCCKVNSDQPSATGVYPFIEWVLKFQHSIDFGPLDFRPLLHDSRSVLRTARWRAGKSTGMPSAGARARVCRSVLWPWQPGALAIILCRGDFLAPNYTRFLTE